MRYHLTDLVIDSPVALPELTRANGEPPSCVFRILDGPGPAPSGWLEHRRLPGGAVWLSIARRDAGYVLRFPGLADFEVSRDGAGIACRPEPETPDGTIRHLFLDQVMPLILHLQGRLVLHATAVAAPAGAVALMGQAGLGKSTLTAALGRAGLEVLGDDCLLVEESGGGPVAIPSYPGLRLWPDVIPAVLGGAGAFLPAAHYSDKRRVSAEDRVLRFASRPAPLHRVYCLPADAPAAESIAIESLGAREAFAELIGAAYRLDSADRGRLSTEFDRLARLARLPLFYRLSYPRDLSRLPQVRDAILDHLAAVR